LKREVLRDGDGASKDVQLRLRRRTRLKEILGETQQEIFSLQKDLSSIKANLALVLGAANL
jgi:N-glycosylase/DNA lyase